MTDRMILANRDPRHSHTDTNQLENMEEESGRKDIRFVSPTFRQGRSATWLSFIPVPPEALLEVDRGNSISGSPRGRIDKSGQLFAAILCEINQPTGGGRMQANRQSTSEEGRDSIVSPLP
ncbi:MAG: hypothetical protein ACR2G5_11130 [Pyrinomonadaceae bacterium]